jgi:hypothetical protein
MNESYKIIDNRTSDKFKKITFSGYKKIDVFNALFKSIESKKIENACNWITEIICSGYIEEIWNKLLIYSFDTININNPKLPNFLYKKNTIFYNIYNNTKNKIDLRNNQNIRNLLFSIVVILSLSSKTKKYNKYPKLKDNDFDYNIFTNRLYAEMVILPEDFIHYNEPEELKVFFNEIYTHLKNNIGGYSKCIYWMTWLFEWEKKNKKINTTQWFIDSRDVDVKDKFKSDLVWIMWDIILLESKNKDMFIKKQILSLYELYKYDFTMGKRNKRLPYLYCAVSYICNKLDSSIDIIYEKDILIQSQINNNKMFESKKINESNDLNNMPPVKITKLKKNKDKINEETEKEICIDKLILFNDIDSIVSR